MVTGGTLFEELGFYYIGPIDGHNMEHLVPVLRNLRDSTEPGPVLLHCVTRKGAGYPPAERAADKYHGVAKFDVITGAQHRSEEHTSELQSLMRISYAVFCVKKNKNNKKIQHKQITPKQQH